MKKRIKPYVKSFTLILCLFAVFSCEEALEIKNPINSLSVETTFSQAGPIELYLNGAYRKTAYASPGRFIPYIFSLLADNSYNPTTHNTAAQNADLIVDDIGRYGYDPAWSGFYEALYQLNVLLEELPNVASDVLTTETRDMYINECKTMRAYLYFTMVTLWGDVPLVTTSNLEENNAKGRTSKSEIWSFIEKELQDASANLPDSKGELFYIKSKYIPLAILASVYLAQEKWADAESAASAVINSGKFSLESDLEDIFLQTSKEAIFTFGTTLDFYDIGPIVASPGAIFLYPGNKYHERYYAAISSSLYNAFEVGDMRKDEWLKYSNTANYVGDSLHRTFCYKYKYSPFSTYSSDQVPSSKREVHLIIRLAETYLTRAEARAEQGNLSGAAADLNMVRNRAGLANYTPGTKEELITKILNERRVELFHEMMYRWFDLTRRGLADQVLSAVPYKAGNWKPYMVLLPLPERELELNKNLVQNPGW